MTSISLKIFKFYNYNYVFVKNLHILNLNMLLISNISKTFLLVTTNKKGIVKKHNMEIIPTFKTIKL